MNANHEDLSMSEVIATLVIAFTCWLKSCFKQAKKIDSEPSKQLGKRVDSLLNEIRPHGRERQMWINAFESASPRVKFYPRKSMVDSWVFLVVAPFVFAQNRRSRSSAAGLGKTTDLRICILGNNFWERGDHTPRKATLKAWITEDDDPGAISISDLVPDLALHEFLDGVEAKKKRLMSKSRTRESLRIREKVRKVSENLTALYPYLDRMKSNVSHLWVSCPECEGSFVVCRDACADYFACNHCHEELVIIGDASSCIGECYPLMGERSENNSTIEQQEESCEQARIKA